MTKKEIAALKVGSRFIDYRYRKGEICTVTSLERETGYYEVQYESDGKDNLYHSRFHLTGAVIKDAILLDGTPLVATPGVDKFDAWWAAEIPSDALQQIATASDFNKETVAKHIMIALRHAAHHAWQEAYALGLADARAEATKQMRDSIAESKKKIEDALAEQAVQAQENGR